MAMNLGRRGTRGGGGRYRPMAEINVTPMVDVMLVLLIIFMITAPLMTSGVNVDLPKASAGPVAQDKDPLTVSVALNDKVYLQDAAIDLPDLITKLQTASQNDPERRIFVRGDKGVPWGRIIEVLVTVKQGGFSKASLLTEQTGTPVPDAPRAPATSATPAPAPAAAARRR